MLPRPSRSFLHITYQYDSEGDDAMAFFLNKKRELTFTRVEGLYPQLVFVLNASIRVWA